MTYFPFHFRTFCFYFSYVIHKIHIIFLVTISVYLKHEEGPRGTVDARVSGKLDSVWKHAHGWVSAMDVKMQKTPKWVSIWL